MCSDEAVKISCKKIKSNINYIDACLNENIDLWRDIILKICELYCSEGLNINIVQFNVKNFCQKRIDGIFNTLMLDIDIYGFLRTANNCEMFCEDSEYKMGIHPICAAMYAVDEKKFSDVKQTDVS